MCEQHCTDKAVSSPEQSVMSREGVPGGWFIGNSSVRHHFIRTLGKQPYSLISLCPTLCLLHSAKFRTLGTLFPFHFVPCVLPPFLYSLYITFKRVCVCMWEIWLLLDQLTLTTSSLSGNCVRVYMALLLIDRETKRKTWFERGFIYGTKLMYCYMNWYKLQCRQDPWIWSLSSISGSWGCFKPGIFHSNDDSIGTYHLFHSPREILRGLITQKTQTSVLLNKTSLPWAV